MKKLTIYLMPLLMAVMMVGCSSDDDNTNVTSPTALYAVLVPDAEQPIDFTPEDYVLTLDNIESVLPLEDTTFKLRNTEKLDSKTLSNYHIWFYSEGRLLFKARLHDALSNMVYSGLVFTHLYTMDGEATYQLAFIRLIHEDGTQEPEMTEQQQRGIQQMLDILSKAGKLKDGSYYADSDDEISILDQNILGTWQTENYATMDKDYRGGLIFTTDGEIKSWGYGTHFDGGSAYKEEHFGYFWFDSDGELHIKAQSKEPIPDEMYYKVTRLTSTQLVIRVYGGIMNTPFEEGVDLVYKKKSLD